jgi:hypothetical protein
MIEHGQCRRFPDPPVAIDGGRRGESIERVRAADRAQSGRCGLPHKPPPIFGYRLRERRNRLFPGGFRQGTGGLFPDQSVWIGIGMKVLWSIGCATASSKILTAEIVANPAS